MLEMFELHDWLENFRISKDIFDYLSDKLRASIQQQDIQLRKGISVKQQVE